MAARDTNPRADAHARPPSRWLAAEALQQRLEEEISRAERHRTPLSCLLVAVENLAELAGEHGALREEALEYLAAALERELRRFDAVGRPREPELLILLPGADDARAEIVARRVLERLRAIKVEVGGTRSALRLAVGLAAWREGITATALVDAARAAAYGAEDDLAGESPAD